MATQTQIEVMARHYCIAAIWADAPEGTHPRANRAAMAHARAVCTRFIELAGPMFDAALLCSGYGSHPDCGNIEPECAAMGHDIYLTSAGHGVGFRDRDTLGELAEKLDSLCGWRCPIGEPCAYFYRGWLYFQGEV